MRMLIVVSAILLSGCGGDPPADNRAANAVAEAQAAGNMAAPGTDAELAQWRADILRGCIGGGRDRVGPDPDVPVERHCECAVERVSAGKTAAQMREEELSGAYEPEFRAAMRACIREISPDFPLTPER